MMGKLKEQIDWEIVQLAKAGILEIGEDHPQYTSGEPSYGMAIMSGRRSGKMQELVDKLTSRCNELAAERDNILDRYNHSVSENTNLRSRCKVLEKHISGLSLLRDHLEEELGKMRERCEKLNAMCIELATDYARAEAERDEARQWARKRYSGNVIMGIQRKNADLRTQSAIDNVRMVGMADEIDDLRAQLAEARNKALDEVMASLTPGIEQCFTFRGRAAIRWALIKVLNLKEKV